MSSDNLKPPYLQFSQCMADNPHSVLIQPDGGFCRCEHENIHDRYGSIQEGVVDAKKLERWRETLEHSDQCPVCALYPSCYGLRYCMSADQPCTDKLQKGNLEKQKKRIESIYIHTMEGKKDESI